MRALAAACLRSDSESLWQTTRVEPGSLRFNDDDSERAWGTSPPAHGLMEQSGAGSGQYDGRSTWAKAAVGANSASANSAAANVALTLVVTRVPPISNVDVRASMADEGA